MKKCPNCGRGTERTEDWVCQWCGYPLLGTGYKKVPKTFRQLQEERGFLRQPEPIEEEAAESPAELAPEPPPKRVPPGRRPPPERSRRAVKEPEPAETPPAFAEEEEEEERLPVRPAAPREQLPGPQEEKAVPEATESVPEAVAEPPAEASVKPVAQPERPPEPEEEEAVSQATESAPEAVVAPEAEAPARPSEPESESELTPVTGREPVEEVAEEEVTREKALLPSPAPVPVPEIDAAAEMVELNVRDLSALYNKDKAKAGEKLTGKIVKITGIVDRAVVNSGLDIYYVLLTSNEAKSWNVRCTFNPDHGSELKRLVKGREATIQGNYAGYERNILLKDCFLV